MKLDEESARERDLYGQRGFSLVEVMAAMAAGLVVLVAASQSVLYFQREFVRQHEQIVQQQDVRLGLELFEQELRLAGWGSLSVVRPDAVEFTANVSGLMTNVIAPAVAGQTTLTVEDGRGWPENKLVRACWNDQCEAFTLARAGMRNLLALVEPALRPIPSGASVMVINRLRYYSRPDEHGIVRWLRQIDGGASVIASDIERLTLSYWDAQGRRTEHPHSVRRILVEIALRGGVVMETREIGLRM
jgi:prepilin-type N-terminal cleavage/methylation domain-containing protein